MALKDHKQELWCAKAVASLIRHHAIQKNNAQFQVGRAILALSQKKETAEKDAVVQRVNGFTWGDW